MKRFLCFRWKESYEKIIDEILKAKNEKSRIEFSRSYLSARLKKKDQNAKFISWVEENRNWLEPKLKEETEFDRLQRKMPPGCVLEIRQDIPLKTYFVFDFR